MSESPFRERRFAPTEVRSLVRRAAEIASRPSAGDATGSAMTAQEIEDRAAELGIPPAALRIAAEEAERPRDDATEASTPGRIVVQVELDGGATDEEIVDVVRDETRDAGTLEHLGETLTWRPTIRTNPRQRGVVPTLSVRVRRKDGRTLVRIDERLWPAKVIGWVAIAMPIALAGGINALVHPLIAGHVALGFTLFAAVMIVAGLLGFTVSSLMSAHRVRKVNELAQRLRHDLPNVGAGVRVGAIATEGGAARVATDADETEADDAPDAARQQRTKS